MTSRIGPIFDLGQSVAVDASGRIVVAGVATNGSNSDVDLFDFALARYTSAGVLDTSFGGGTGKVISPIVSSDDFGASVVIDASGRIIVAGAANNGSNYDFALARYTSAGVLDSSFGGGTGKVISPIGSGDDVGYSVAIDASGKIVVAGVASNGSNRDFALARYTSAGALDTSFGGGTGKVISPIGAGDDVGRSVVIDASGRIVVAGVASNGSNNDFALARYTSAGGLDTSFGGGTGKVISPIGSGDDVGRSVVIDASGRIVVAGYALNSSGDSDFALARYTSAGVLDTSFGGGTGKVISPIGSGDDFGASVAIDASGRIVVAGYAKNSDGKYGFAVARYQGDSSNTAPVLNATPTPVLTAINEDAGAPSGAVGTVVSALVDLNPPVGGLNNVTDPDSNAVTGIAITAADITNGTWFYSTTNGTTWTALGTPATTAALLLAADANTRVYFRPTANYNGTVTTALTFRAWDTTSGSNGSTADTSTNGGTTAFSIVTDTAAITVNAINDQPSFIAINPVAVSEDAGAQTLANWATFNPGAANESSQTATYTVNNLSNAALFAVAPTVAANGTLTYQAAANAFGNSTFDVVVQDSGGTANGGIDTSVKQTFTITVNAVNDAPSFTALALVPTLADSGLQTVKNWATFNPGAANELSQTATYTVSNLSNAALFNGAPIVATDGTLTYQAALNASGTSTFDVLVKDSGGTANGGVDTSVKQTFTITIAPRFILPIGPTNIVPRATPQLDFTGDGKADIVWRNAAIAKTAIWGMDGNTLISTTELPTVPKEWSIEAVADFDGNGKGDLLWRNNSTQKLAIWQMNGTALAQSGFLPERDKTWQVMGTGDFNGDGKADILWRNTSTGQNAVWLINGVQLFSSYDLTPEPDQKWQVAGVGDFNGDGKADIVWSNQTTNQNAIWQLNGAALLSAVLLPTFPAAGWAVAAVGDVNGDGQADLIWRNASTGGNAAWLMNGTAIAQKADLTTVADPNWQIASVGDVDRDGKADLIWRNYSTGENGIWTMNGTPAKTQNLTTKVGDFNWDIA